VPTFVDRRVSRGQRGESPRPIIDIDLISLALKLFHNILVLLSLNNELILGVIL
jgi:hypothetical protein